MNRVFVINPKAGRGMGERGVAKLEAYFRRRGSSFHAILSQSRDDVIDRTREALRQGAERSSRSQEGTVNAVANGFFENGELVRPDACLAIAKAGSGSDYFRGLTQTTRRNWPRSCFRRGPPG